MSFPTNEALNRIYGAEADKAEERYRHLEKMFGESFPDAADKESLRYFTAPGRTEIIGNHTDHNGGQILAASITLDTVAAAVRTDDGLVRIISEGYRKAIEVNTLELEKATPENTAGSTALVAGILTAAKEFGYKIGGLRAYVTSAVIPSAGVSSSASFEMLVCSMINAFFNSGEISVAQYARMGQFAENRFWKKASGLMDQMACAVGGTIFLDFSDGVKYEPVDFAFGDLGCDMILVNTGKGHADLSEEYSSIPNEMRKAAGALSGILGGDGSGSHNLCEFPAETFYANLPAVRRAVNDDRAVLRAMHFYEECARVKATVAALEKGDKEAVLSAIEASGNSSWKWLQNTYVSGEHNEESVALTLALTEKFLTEHVPEEGSAQVSRGVTRIHGGGFAGVIMCVVPHALTEEYVVFISPLVGRENVYAMNIRRVGAAEV